MIQDLISQLRKTGCPVAADPFSVWRDDDQLPFSNLQSTPLLIRQQQSDNDPQLYTATYDLFLHSAANVDNAAMNALRIKAEALIDWINDNWIDTTTDTIGFDIVSGLSGPFKDGQGRWIFSFVVRQQLDPKLPSLWGECNT
jgi:hypothetical protein